MVLLVGILNYHIYQDFLYLQLQLILGVGWIMSPELELSRLQWCSGGSDSGGSGSGGVVVVVVVVVVLIKKGLVFYISTR